MNTAETWDSEWNSAEQFFRQLGLIQAAINDCTIRRDNKGLLDALYTLHKQLIGQMKEEELNQAWNLMIQADRMVNDNRFNPSSERKKLFDYELYLRRIMKVRKLDLPRSKDPSRALLGGGMT
jgi:hypothetical protein